MSLDDLAVKLNARFGQGLEWSIEKDNLEVRMAPAQIPVLAGFARDELGFDMLDAITAVDNIETFELLYHFVSLRPQSPSAINPAYPGYLLMRVIVPKDEEEPVVPSLVSLYPGANHQEREIYDLMGIRFKGHPKLERILTWEGFPGHPLRKDWEPLNAEIPWHLAGLTGFGGETLENAPAFTRIAADGTGMSERIPIGTTPQAFNREGNRPAKPTEKIRLKIGQGGIVEDETPGGPRSGYGAAPELGRAATPEELKRLKAQEGQGE